MNQQRFIRAISLTGPLGVLLSFSAVAVPLMGQQTGGMPLQISGGTIKLIPQGTPPFVLGDTVQIDVNVDLRTNKTTGVSLYITLDENVFEPVLDEDGYPFIDGPLLGPGGSGSGSLHGDSLALGADSNNIPGWQLDYFRNTQVQPRITVSGKGLVASFFVKIINLPVADPILQFDSNNFQIRKTGYHTYNPPADVGSFWKFANHPAPDTLTLAGIAIRPPIPDTVIVPGSTLDLYMGDHFTSNVIDSTQAIWSGTRLAPGTMPGGANFSVLPANGPTTRLTFSTDSTNHFVLVADVAVQGTDTSGNLFQDNQVVTITVNHVPVFGPNLLANYAFDEDSRYRALGNGGGTGGLFTDKDDFGANIMATVEPDNLVHVSYDAATDSIFFFADTNRFGSESVRLTITDGLGFSVDTLLQFTVNPVNDAPTINLDNFAGGPRDTLITHRSVTDTVDLTLYTTDIDDNVLVYTHNDPSSTDLTPIISGTGLMLVAVNSSAIFADYSLIITVTDTAGAFASDTLVVSIRSWPPVIDATITDIVIVAGNPDTVSLSPLVTDIDTDDSVMSWSFEVRDFLLDTLDTQVDVSNYDSLTQTLEIVTQPGYSALDRLIFYVQDDDGNRDTSFARLAIFSTLNPAIFPFPIDTVIMDRQTTVLDLDDFVIDPHFSPDTLTWTYTGGDSLAGITVGFTDHILTVSTNATFFGWDTITFVVTNPDSLTDTSALVLRVLPEFDGPPTWDAFEAYEVVFPDTTGIGLLTDFAVDDFTAVEDLIYGVFPNPDVSKPLDIVIDSTTWDIKLVATSPEEFLTWVVFTAQDVAGQLTVSDTVWISVRDSYSPVWDNINNVLLGLTETKTDTLSRYLTDRDTPLSSMTVTVSANRTDVVVTYDPATTIITYRSKDIETTVDVTYTAVDDSNNVAVTSNTIFVRIPADDTPPEALTTYYFHPVQIKRIEYLLIADSTASGLSSIYIFNDRQRPLSLIKEDTLGATFTWYGQDKMELPGIYELISEVNDLRNNVRRMSLTLSIDFSKKIGGQITSANGDLSVSYPATSIPEGHLIIISNAHTSRGGSSLGAEPGEIEYSLDTNLPEDLLMTVRYRRQGHDGFYAFYDVTDGARERIPTYKTGFDTYEAYVSTGKTITFDESPVKAGDALPSTARLWTHPNPFNATLQMSFMLRLPDRGQIKIYNLLGQEIFSTKRKDYAPGIHSLAWHGRDQYGRQVASGIYFVQLTTDRGLSQLRKVTLLK